MQDHRPRTVSSQLRQGAGFEDPASGTHAWNEWGSTGYSPDRPTGSGQSYGVDNFDMLAENSFGDFPAQRSSQGQYQLGLGFEVQVQMSGIEEEPSQEKFEAAELENRKTAGANAPAFGRLSGHYSQSHPASTSSSPARSRASSLHSIAPPTLQMSALTSPTSSFFPGGLPSPFHDHPTSFVSSTINPAQSVRSSSPSDTSSVSGLNMSRIESGSAGSSVYGDSTAPSTPYRSNSISSRGTGSELQSHQKHLRRRSSPIKGTNRHARKLSNADRKAICQFHIAHPGLKQDDIGAHFGFERSTISKTLKYKDKYLNMDSEDETSASAVIRSAREERATYGPSSLNDPTPDDSQQYAEYAQHSLAASSSVSSLVSLDSQESFGAPAPAFPPAKIVGGRFPAIDNGLATWAREQVAHGLSLSDATMQREAKSIAASLGSSNFKASQTWLDGFKQRAGIAHGTFRDMVPLHRLPQLPSAPNSPPAPVPTPTPTSQRWLPPPKEEEDEDEEEEDAVPREDDEYDEDYDLPTARRSKRRLGAKTVRRLTSAKSALASFADGVMGSSRSNTPAAQRADHSSPFAGGTFGDLSMDADATPTHTTIHSRTSTSATERPNGLAQAFSYSPSAVSDTGSVVTSTPSRLSQQPSMLGDDSPPEPFHQLNGYPGGLEASYPSQDFGAFGNSLSSSHSSLANFDGGVNALAPSSFDQSPAQPQYHHHGRSGSTASTNSVYSGLTAFSNSHSQGPGTPLTGNSLYGSFRDCQSNLGSLPGTPAFGADQSNQMHAFPSSAFPTHSASLQYSQPPSSSQHHHQQPHQQPSSHRYPVSSSSSSHPYPGTPNHPHDSIAQPGSGGRRNTISGGAPFSGRGSSAMSASLSQSQLPAGVSPCPSPSLRGPPVTLEQAFSSLDVAFEYLQTRAGQDYVSPKDLIVLSELRSKMERARNAQGVNLAAISGSAPPTPSGHGPSPFSPASSQPNLIAFPTFQQPFQQPFQQQQQQHGMQAPVAAFAQQKGAQRLRLARTQSTSSVPSFGGMGMYGQGGNGGGGTAGALERGMLTRRSGSSLSLYEVEGH